MPMLYRNEGAAKGIEQAVEAMLKLYTGWKCLNCGNNSTRFGILHWDVQGDPRCPACCSGDVEVKP